MPRLHSNRMSGDLYVQAQAEFPTNLTDEEKHLLGQLAQLRTKR